MSVRFLSFSSLVSVAQQMLDEGRSSFFVGPDDHRVEVPFQIVRNRSGEIERMILSGAIVDAHGNFGDEAQLRLCVDHRLGIHLNPNGQNGIFRASARDSHADPIRRFASRVGIRQSRVLYSNLGVIYSMTEDHEDLVIHGQAEQRVHAVPAGCAVEHFGSYSSQDLQADDFSGGEVALVLKRRWRDGEQCMCPWAVIVRMPEVCPALQSVFRLDMAMQLRAMMRSSSAAVCHATESEFSMVH